MTTVNYHIHAFDDTIESFSVNCQRPPVPGEENDQLQKQGSGSSNKTLPLASKKNGESTSSVRDATPSVPRRLTNEISARNCPDTKSVATKLDQCDLIDAPLGFEPEGSTSLSSNFQESSNSSTLSCLKWAENFNYLLQDSDGVNLFKEFLDDQEENCGALDFWFACSGLKMVSPTDTDRIAGLVKLIYKKYVKGNNLGLNSDVKRHIIDRMKRETIDQTIFDEAQVEVENVMRNDLYPLFLKSDIYLEFVQAGGDSPKVSHNTGATEGVFSGSGIDKLPTLHEEEELKSDTLNDKLSNSFFHSLPHGATKVRNGLTPDRCCGISYAGHKSKLSHPYHNSYAPVSAQDSELQSLSSDALTDETKSEVYTDSSLDGREYAVHRSKMALRKQAKVMRRNADRNQHTGLNQHFIPRTEVVKPDCNLAEKDPTRFATLLNERLLKVIEEQDKQERFLLSMRSIQENDDESSQSTSQHRSSIPNSTTFNSSVGSFPFASMLFASALANDSDHEDNAQSILDDHVSHIWNSSGVTPSRSPGPLTPDHAKRDPGLHAHGLGLVGSSVPKSRSKELAEQPPGFGLTSKEGKFIHPLSSKNQQHSGKEHRSISSRELELSAQMRRLLSAPGASSSNPTQAKIASHLPRSCAEDARHVGAKPHAQNTEAGDAITGSCRVENCTADRHPLASSDVTTERVMMWMLDNEKYCEGRAHCSTDCSDKGSSNKRSSHKSAGKKGSNHKTNRSESLDHKISALPASDFAFSQRTVNQPSTVIRLDEVKRLLNDDTRAAFMKTSCQGKVKAMGESNDAKKQDFTVVGYYFCDEPIPYRTTIPDKSVTLGQLKQLIAKKGNYRYFFKKACPDFECGIVQEEITRDDDVLPLWDGKVVCKVERLV